MAMKQVRGKQHTIAIGWGVEVAKVCQVHFPRKGGFYVTFPYHPDAEGVAALCIAKPGKMQFQLADEESRVTSHKIKYHHPMDGRAHFSQDGKIKTEIWSRGLPSLIEEGGHLFTVQVQGLPHFHEMKVEEYDSGTMHMAELQQDEPPETVRLVGRFNRLDADALSWPRVRVRSKSTGREADMLALAPPAGTPLDGFGIFVEVIPQERVGPEDEPFFLSFQGGFEPGMADPTVEASFLVLNYPARQIDQFRSMDFHPKAN
ncbi:MAG: hypothetical protein QOG04_1849 [Actinomycetota bacterium]|jgi:hypothetical protein|nr:hypothetical protein [Actinomycetota bacterium]